MSDFQELDQGELADLGIIAKPSILGTNKILNPYAIGMHSVYSDPNFKPFDAISSKLGQLDWGFQVIPCFELQKFKNGRVVLRPRPTDQHTSYKGDFGESYDQYYHYCSEVHPYSNLIVFSKFGGLKDVPCDGNLDWYYMFKTAMPTFKHVYGGPFVQFNPKKQILGFKDGSTGDTWDVDGTYSSPT